VSAPLLGQVKCKKAHHLFIVTNNCAAFIKLLPNNDGRKPVFVEFCWTGIVITRVNHNRSVDASSRASAAVVRSAV